MTTGEPLDSPSDLAEAPIWKRFQMMPCADQRTSIARGIGRSVPVVRHLETIPHVPRSACSVSPKACADRHGSQKGRPAIQSGPRRPMTLGNMRARIRTRTIASPRSNPKLARSRCSPSEAKSGDQRGALRVIDPGLPRPFRTPAIHTVAPAGARHDSPGKERWTQLLPIPCHHCQARPR
jgi:hypothetical protein